MSDEKTLGHKMTTQYAAVDAARFVCALLVVAIHVRPLSTYTELGNFLLDKGLCRIAVPFFFLASGYFWARKPVMMKSLGAFLWRIVVLYVLWTAIYYPVVVESQDMNNYWRRCLLSGSYYHLWYYPAMFVAAVLTFLGWRVLTPGAFSKPSAGSGGLVVLVALACYFIGCMGESYYGLFADNARVVELAEAYFALFWSTRSGLFFGFLFFALGVFLQKNRWQMSRRKAAVAFAVSLGLMFAEIMTLRSLNVARDYNLYFALIPATVFLFLWLTGKPSNLSPETIGVIGGASSQETIARQLPPPQLCAFLRKSSVLIYGIHLWFKYYGVKYAEMVMAGTLAQDAGPLLMRLAEGFVNDSMVQYVVICILSFGFAAVILVLQRIHFLKFLKYLY